MDKFSIVDLGASKGEIKFFTTQLKRNGLIAGTEEDSYGDPIYHTNRINSVKKLADEFDGIMIDMYKKKY